MDTKSFSWVMGFIFFLAACIGNVHAAETKKATGSGPVLRVSPQVAPIGKRTKFVVMGSGFSQGQRISVVCDDPTGVVTVLMGEAVANKRGSWAFAWAPGKLLTEGVYAVMVLDKDENILVSAPMALINIKKNPKDWPEWAKAAGIKVKKKKKK